MDKAAQQDPKAAARVEAPSDAHKPLNPEYACDAVLVPVTKNFSFVFGPCSIHPFIAVSLPVPVPS